MVMKRDKRENVIYFSLGSNLNDKKTNLNRAIDFIIEEIGFVFTSSSIYETEGWGNKDLSTFYNMVIGVYSYLEKEAILKKTQTIEKEMGRTKKTNPIYINRLIDIDILFFNNDILETDKLIIPHKELINRNFVLVPMVEISPHLIHPQLNKSMFNLLKECKDEMKCIKIS